MRFRFWRKEPKDPNLLRQMRINAEALLRHYSLWRPDILTTQVDRVLFVHSWELIMGIEALERREKFIPWDHVANHGLTAKRGWRERVACCSCQIIEHDHAIELDFDLMNPDRGILPAIGHLVEILVPGKTNSFRVMKRLRKRGIPVPDVRKENHEKILAA